VGQTTIPLDVLLGFIESTSLLAGEVFVLPVLFAGMILTTISLLHVQGYSRWNDVLSHNRTATVDRSREGILESQEHAT